MRLLLGDMREVLRTLEPESIDAVVCDPPYEIGFMAKAWDSAGAVEFCWCKGHAGTPENNRADVLAGEARRRAERRATPDLADRLRNISDAFFSQEDQR